MGARWRSAGGEMRRRGRSAVHNTWAAVVTPMTAARPSSIQQGRPSWRSTSPALLQLLHLLNLLLCATVDGANYTFRTAPAGAAPEDGCITYWLQKPDGYVLPAVSYEAGQGQGRGFGTRGGIRACVMFYSSIAGRNQVIQHTRQLLARPATVAGRRFVQHIPASDHAACCFGTWVG